MKIYSMLLLAFSFLNIFLAERVFSTEPPLTESPTSPVAEMEKIQVTPLDVAKGYSAKYRIVLKAGDKKPKDWGADDYLWYRTLAQVRHQSTSHKDYIPELRADTDRINYDKKQDAYVTMMRFTISKVPAYYGRVEWTSSFGAQDGIESNKDIIAPIPFKIVLRKSGVQEIPVVSKAVPLTVVRTKIEKGLSSVSIRLFLKLQRGILPQMLKTKTRVVSFNSVIETQTGERRVPIFGDVPWGFNKEGLWEQEWTIQNDEIPPNATRLVLKTKISMNDSWPLSVAVKIPIKKTASAL